MCGIAGILTLGDRAAGPEPAQLGAMIRTLRHRGPDCDAVDVQGNVGLAFSRLAIIDLEGGMQPIYNEDGTVRVICNGEIYNYRQLRSMLRARGHRFATDSDTEVLVHLWEEYGSSFTEHLNGMFAIALHDMRRKCVVLVRDHMGIKPLFYAVVGDHLVFGSEIKAVLASKLVERELDVDAVGQFLAWEYVPGKATLLRSVRKLEPASMVHVDLSTGTVQRHEYWDIARAQDVTVRSAEQWEDAIAEALQEAVGGQLVSDVPVGAFLSGGVDSSLIVAGMGKEARTFSIGFDDPSYNELPWSNRVASHLGVEHKTAIIQPKVAQLFDQLMHHMDDPIADFSIFPTYLVSQHAREEVRVALSGDGGDELFGGYETYIAQEKAAAWRRVPALVRSGVVEPAVRMLAPSAQKKGLINKAKRFVEGLEHDEALGHARWRLFMGEALRAEIFTSEVQQELLTPIDEHIADLQEKSRDRDALHRALYVDARSYLVDNCLVKVDRMSMACSLEVRVPFLDRNLVDLAFGVPSHLKVRSGKTKIVLKRIACRHIPAECVHRRKEGFSVPMKHWLRGAFAPLLEEYLDPSQLAREGLFCVDVVQRLKAEHMSNRANHSHLLWALMVFQDWRRRWGA